MPCRFSKTCFCRSASALFDCRSDCYCRLINAVNLTDGLDGLAIVPTMIAAASFGFIAYLVGNAIFANYLQVHYVPGTGETGRVLCRAYRLGSRLSLV